MPLQQSLRLTHGALKPAHVPASDLQTPLTHEPEQHWLLKVQLPCTGRQGDGAIWQEPVFVDVLMFPQ